ncbi:hypothetical protein [Photobacterium damselae]|uniref:hypothetical protein n=1 Tax=Photobacterium damselae TaxID=38293 RepID=UPI0015938D89|nr:hypothetical protein [Photobacterium damselae]NVH48267.1 hypothetical protein [Photobacterium damselae subsp. damselae]
MKILYLSHIDWLWIKQRPQFLAEELSKYHDVDVYYQPSFRKSNLQSKSSLLDTYKLFKLPLKNKFSILFFINNLIQKTYIQYILDNNDYDLIYITHPEFYPIIKECNYDIVYDCMDDHENFFSKSDVRHIRYSSYEKKICNLDRVRILTSSNSLKDKISKFTNKEIKVVRNGLKDSFVLNIKTVPKNEVNISKEKKIITYIGTIAEWFDFDLLNNTNNNEVEYHLYGPKEVDDSKFNNNIIYKGVLEHDELADIAGNSDALIMPFIVNDLIKSVDPVKLYEYISFNKPIICCFYDEISRFDNFVNFYHDSNSFSKIINDLASCKLKLYKNEDALLFLSNSTWSSRGKSLNDIISKKQ